MGRQSVSVNRETNFYTANLVFDWY